MNDAHRLTELATSAGVSYFGALARFAAEVSGADAVLVAMVVGDDWERLRILAMHNVPDELGLSREAVLHGAPWGLHAQEQATASTDCRARFPADRVLAALGAESMIKLVLTDAIARPLGMVALLSRDTLPPLQAVTLALEGPLARATHELETLHTLASLGAIVQATAPGVRGEVYRAVVDACVRVLGVDVAYVATVEAGRRRARTLALRDGHSFVANVAYDLAGTPCERIYDTAERVFVPSDVQRQFPADEYLRERGLESYLAIPLLDEARHVIGHIGLAHQRPLQTSAQADTLLAALAARAAAELAYQREEEERLAIERKLLGTQKLESLGVLAGGIAHDFNNLLVAILGNASLAMRESHAASPTMRYLEEIEKAARRAADLARQMLAYSGKGQLTMSTVDLSKVVEDMTNLLQVSLPKKVVIRYDLDPQLPKIHADATQLRQLVMNFVLNGAEAIGDRSGVVSVTTGLVRLDQSYLRGLELGQDLAEGEYVYLEVADTGCGIDAETLGKIFDPFFTTKATGRGLGLAAAQGIVRSHRGAIKVYSEVGRGTTFKLLFPVAEGQVERAVESAAAQTKPLPTGTEILVVDDEDSVRAVACRMLEALGAKVTQACNGLEALELFRARPDEIACVLVDMNMPHMGGAELFRELRRLRRNVRVVLMSGYNESDATSVFAGKGLAGFVQKPFSFDDFRRVIEHALSPRKEQS